MLPRLTFEWKVVYRVHIICLWATFQISTCPVTPANKTATPPTTIQVTPLGVLKDSWGCFQTFFHVKSRFVLWVFLSGSLTIAKCLKNSLLTKTETNVKLQHKDTLSLILVAISNMFEIICVWLLIQVTPSSLAEPHCCYCLILNHRNKFS